MGDVRLVMTTGSVVAMGRVSRKGLTGDPVVQRDVRIKATESVLLALEPGRYYYEFDVQHGSGAFALAARQGQEAIAERAYPGAAPFGNVFDFTVS
jgi:hypothetical protein